MKIKFPLNEHCKQEKNSRETQFPNEINSGEIFIIGLNVLGTTYQTTHRRGRKESNEGMSFNNLLIIKQILSNLFFKYLSFPKNISRMVVRMVRNNKNKGRVYILSYLNETSFTLKGECT